MKSMKLIAQIILGMSLSFPAFAALHDRGGGLIYDDSLNITWFQDANLFKTLCDQSNPIADFETAVAPDSATICAADGLMAWQDARSWINHLNTLNYLGYHDWRLWRVPAATSDATCSEQDFDGGSDRGYGCTGSELGNLYTQTLGNSSATCAPDCLTNTGPFLNMQPRGYWSDTVYFETINPNTQAWHFYTNSGYQDITTHSSTFQVWMVRTGDVEADLSVTLGGTPATVIAGSGAGNLTYTVQVGNLGPLSATGVTVDVQALLPAGVTFDSWVPANEFDGQTWSVGILDFGESKTLTITATVASNAAPCVSCIDVQATISGNVSDPEPDNDHSSHLASITRSTDLATTVVGSPDPVTAGSGVGNLSYTIQVSNLGASDGTGISAAVPITVPTGVSIDSWAPINEFDGSTWTIGTLASAASKTLTLTLTAAANAAACVNCISVSANASGIESDPNPGNNLTSDLTSIQTSADLALTVTGNPDPVSPDGTPGNLVYTLQISNLGASDATGVSVATSTTLPAGVTVDSWIPNNEYDGSTWTVGSLTSGSSRTLTITMTVDVAATSCDGCISISANAVANENDPEPNNNQAAYTTSIRANIGDRAIPTLSQWALILLVLMLSALSYKVLVRKGQQ